MKKLIVIIIALVAVATSTFAKESSKPVEKAPIQASVLTGKIIDKVSGEELVGVAVRIDGTENICYTDFEGNFAFNNIKPGSYKLDVEMISYEKVTTQKIQVEANEAHELKIKLEQDK